MQRIHSVSKRIMHKSLHSLYSTVEHLLGRGCSLSSEVGREGDDCCCIRCHVSDVAAAKASSPTLPPGLFAAIQAGWM